MTRRLLTLLLVVAMAVLIAAPSHAATDAFHRMIAKLHSLRSYQATVSAHITYGSVAGGRPNAMAWTSKILYKRPNRVLVTLEGFMGGVKVVSDGQTMYTYSPLSNQYTKNPAPPNLIDSVLANSTVGGGLKQVGSSTIGGEPVFVLKGTISSSQGPVQTTYYIGKNDSLPRRIVVIVHVPGPQGQTYRMVNEQEFTSQKTNTAIADSNFRFTVPSGATKVSNLGGMSTGGGTAGAFDGLP